MTRCGGIVPGFTPRSECPLRYAGRPAAGARRCSEPRRVATLQPAVKGQRPISTPTSTTTANVPKSADLEPVRMMWTAASMASSLAPAKRVENRCVRISKRDASEGSEDNAGEGEGGADADGGRCAAADAGLRPLRPKANGHNARQ
jgi:hypothetical protein